MSLNGADRIEAEFLSRPGAFEAMFRNLFDSMEKAAVILKMIYDSDGKVNDYLFLAANPAFEAHSGLRVEQVVGKRVNEAFPIVEPIWFDTLGEVARSHRSKSFEEYSAALDRWYKASASPLAEKDCIAVIFEDVTNDRKAEDLLTRQTALLNSLIDSIPDLIFYKDTEGVYIGCNPPFAEFVGRPRDEIVGRTDQELFAKDVADFFREQDRKMLELGQPRRNDEWVTYPDRRRRLLDTLKTPYWGPDGELVGILGVSRDITDRMMAEEALRESEALYRTLFDNTEDAFALIEPIFDEEGNSNDYIVIEVNEAWTKQTGLRREDFVGKHISESMPSIEPVWAKFYGDVSKTGVASRVEDFNQHTGRWFDQYAFPYKTGRVGVLFRDITERKRAEEALRESEGRYHQRVEELEALMDTVPAAIWVAHDRECRVITGNQAADKFYEAKGDENVSAGPTSGDEWDKTRRFFQDGRELRPEELPMQEAAAAGHEVRGSELEVLLPSGHRMTMFGNAKPLFDDRGNVRGSVASFLDITERKKAEQALRESESKYRSLFESMGESFQVLDLAYDRGGKVIDGMIVDVNPAFEQLTGMPREQLVGRTLKQAFGVIEDYWLEMYQKVDETGEPEHYINYGGELDKYFEMAIWKAAEGRIAITSMDVTEVKRAEHELKVERDRLSSLINSMSDEVWLADANGKIIMVNEAVLKEYGLSSWSPEGIELITSKYKVYRPDGTPRPTEEAPPLRALKGEHVRGQEEIVRTPATGELRNRMVSASPIVGANGEVIGSVSVVRDITDIKAVQRRAEEYASKLERSNAELQQFAYVASHDLQEPLRMVTSYIGLMNKKFGDELPPKAKEYMSIAVDGSMRMKELINDLLQYSRIDSQTIALEEINMTDMMKSVEADLHVAIKESRAELIIKPLPTIHADRTQIKQLLTNLVSNAIKFRGESSPRIEVTAITCGEENVFSIQDNGIGIDPKYAEKLFRMFSRLHTRDEYPGTGIGLAIAKKIVERHGGRIWFKSEAGKGTTFFFTIPKE